MNEIEGAIGLAFIRGQSRLSKKDALQKKREEGKGARRASVRDFHSFRVTWITLALAAGVPLEIVQRVTGHKTVEIVLKHYFRPGREDFKHTIMKAMPALLSEPKDEKVIDVESKEVPANKDPKASTQDLDRALALLRGVTGKANQKLVAEVGKLIRSAQARVQTSCAVLHS